MNKTILKKYADYFLDKFKTDKKLKFDVVADNKDMFAVYIYSNSNFSEYFLRVDYRMIYIDGIVVQDTAIEYDDINKVDADDIYRFLDNQADLFQLFLNEGVNLFAYKGNNEVLGMSTDITDRKKLLTDIDIKKFYNQQVFKNAPLFEELDRIVLQDFYGEVIYSYNVKNSSK